MQTSGNFPKVINHQEHGPVVIRNLGLTDYIQTWHAMQAFTSQRNKDTPDEIWMTEHFPIYTLGLNSKGTRLPIRNDIPVIETDRGGKITYHGPGQLIAYLMLDIDRMKLTTKHLVASIENNIIHLLRAYGIAATTIRNAPGVYVNNQKISSLGLRVKRGLSYHGLSINVDMDLSPFLSIDPCGYPGMKMTQLSDLGVHANTEELSWNLVELFAQR